MRDDPPSDDLPSLDPAERQALVAEAFHTFGETAARQLADRLGVRFEGCAEDIERIRYRPQ